MVRLRRLVTCLLSRAHPAAARRVVAISVDSVIGRVWRRKSGANPEAGGDANREADDEKRAKGGGGLGRRVARAPAALGPGAGARARVAAPAAYATVRAARGRGERRGTPGSAASFH